MAKSLRLHALLALAVGALGGSLAERVLAQASALVGCVATDNGAKAAAHFRVWRSDTQISGAICGNDVAVPAGAYELEITLDGVLGAQAQRVPVQVRPGQLTRGQAEFATGELLIEVTRDGRRSVGMAVLKKGNSELARLSAGVATRIGVGTYILELESRGEQRRMEGVAIVRGERRVIAVEFPGARASKSVPSK